MGYTKIFFSPQGDVRISKVDTQQTVGNIGNTDLSDIIEHINSIKDQIPVSNK